MVEQVRKVQNEV